MFLFDNIIDKKAVSILSHYEQNAPRFCSEKVVKQRIAVFGYGGFGPG